MASDKLIDRLSRLRYNNTSGKVIPLHHAFKTIYSDSSAVATTVLMAVFFLIGLWFFLPLIVAHWGHVMAFWMDKIYGGKILFEDKNIMGQEMRIPYPDAEVFLPSETAVWINVIVCTIALIASFFFPRRLAPVFYFIRAMLVIQISASVDRFINPEYFPYTMREYMVDAISLSAYLILTIPLVLAFIYYIFDFGLWRKCALTLLAVSFYLFFIPCQYMLHTLIIKEGSVLFMPITYMFFGTLLDVLMFVAIYSFGMSWNSHKVRMHGREI